MTADFLFTASDLEGWRGDVSNLDIKNIIDKSLAELSNGNWDKKNLSRELAIIKKVAYEYKLIDFFNKKVSSYSRNTKKEIIGNAVSHKQIYLDASDLGIKNILDAAYFCKFIHNASENISFKTLFRLMGNSISHKISMNTNAGKFPQESEWPKL